MPRGVRKQVTEVQKEKIEKAKNYDKIRKNVGRTLLHIDWDFVDKNLENGCSGVQVAAAMGMHEDTLYKRTIEEKGMAFSDYRQQKMAKGESALLSKQHELAFEKNAMMLIWLGKNRLGQRDTPQEIEVSKETMSNFKEIADQLKSYQERLKEKE